MNLTNLTMTKIEAAIIEATEKYTTPKVTVEGRNERVASLFNNRKKTNISQPQHNTQHYGGK